MGEDRDGEQKYSPHLLAPGWWIPIDYKCLNKLNN